MYDWIQDRESFNRAFEQSPDFLMREARERETGFNEGVFCFFTEQAVFTSLLFLSRAQVRCKVSGQGAYVYGHNIKGYGHMVAAGFKFVSAKFLFIRVSHESK